MREKMVMKTDGGIGRGMKKSQQQACVLHG
jgi:hypothetical protein